MGLLGSVPAGAQVGPEVAPSLQRLEVALWPEYDRSEMLVILRGELSPETLTPARLALPIPADVTDLHAVAWRDPQGGLKLAQYTVEERDGRRFLNVTLPSHSFRVEYYDGLQRDGDLRTHAFEWPGGPAISSMGYELQNPPGASEVTLSPPPVAEGVADDGLTYSRGELGAVPSGEARSIEISYRKSSDALTAAATRAPPPSAPAATSALESSLPPPRSETPWWPVYVAAALLVGILIGWLLQRGSE